MPVWAEREGIRLSGFASLPTHSKAAATAQYLFVNGRPVRDRMLVGALRGAYADVLVRDRHPIVVLFLEAAPERVDVNVHPAKAEVRFREPGLVRGLIVGALKAAIAEHGQRTAPARSHAALGAFQPEHAAPVYQFPAARHGPVHAAPGFSEMATPYARTEPATDVVPADCPLGAARAQLHENYIVAQSEDGMVLVDAHAAHERLTYEKLKARMATGTIAAQSLLMPEIVELGEEARAVVLEAAPDLDTLGLEIEPFGGGAVCIRAIPALLGNADPAAILRDVADELIDEGTSHALETRLNAILSRIACHGSVRSGRRMNVDENERPPQGDGGDAGLRPMQSRAAHLCHTVPRGHRNALRTTRMIQIGDTLLDFNDPLTLATAIGGGLFLVLLLLVFLALRAAARSARATEPLGAYLVGLGDTVKHLDRGQIELTGRLQAVTESQATVNATHDADDGTAA